jgi:hypothetical protein
VHHALAGPQDAARVLSRSSKTFHGRERTVRGMAYTLKNLMDTEDVAVANGMGEQLSARFPREDLGCRELAFSLQQIRPGVEMPFGHTHKQAEEVYVVLRCSGRAKLDDEVADLEPMDALRVSPETMRAFAAGPEGLDLLVFGARYEDDAVIATEPWRAR